MYKKKCPIKSWKNFIPLNLGDNNKNDNDNDDSR